MPYNCGKMNGIQRKHATATASHVDNIHIQRSLFLCAAEITVKFMAKQKHSRLCNRHVFYRVRKSFISSNRD